MAQPGLLGGAADLVPDALLLVRLDGTVVDCNQAATRLVPGMRAGASLPDMVTDPPDEVRQTLARWSRAGEPMAGALTFRGGGGTPVRCRCRGSRALWLAGEGTRGAAGTVMQVHVSAHLRQRRSALDHEQFVAQRRELAHRRRVAAERERAAAAEQDARDRMQRRYRLSAALTASATLADVAAVVRAEATTALGGTTAVLGLFPDRVLPVFRERRRRGGPGAWHDIDADPGGPLAAAARSRGPVLVTDPARPLARYSAVAACHDHVACFLPLELRARRLGVLAVALPVRAAGDLPEREHMLAVAAQVAQAVARASLFEHEHRLAERLQLGLLPALPEVDHLTVASRYLPGTGSVRVGGDWYDLFELGPGRAGLAIGDVAGHSVAEATVMAQLHNALRAAALEHRAPGAALARVNDFTHAFLPVTMATACYLTLDTRSGSLRFASAGHPPPLLITADGGPRLLWGTPGPALGAAPGVRYPGRAVAMAPGDTLLLYTDGLVERRGEPLDAGLSRLLATARQAAGLAPDALCDLLTRDRSGTRWPDDRALLAVRLERASHA